MAKQPTPFNFDPFNTLAQFKVPGMDIQQMMDTHRKNVEAVTQANQAVFQGMQAVATRQAEIMRTTLEEFQKGMQALMDASAENRATKQAELAREAFEKGLENMRELAEMIVKSQNEAFEKINARVQDSLKEFQGAVDAAKSGK